MSFAWILIIGISIMAGTLALVTGWERRRARLLIQAGEALGLRGFQKGEPLRVPSVELMRKGGRTIGAALEGVWRGTPITVFDLSYRAGKSVSQNTVFMLRLPQPRLPEFAAIRKDILLYTPTVDLPVVQHPPNSLRRHWYLHSRNADWPFDSAVSPWLERNKNWSIEGSGSGLFLYQRGKRVSTKRLDSWLDEALAESQEFMRCVPSDIPYPATDVGEQSPSQKVYRFKASFRIG